MFAHISGIVAEKNVDSIVIDAGGIGFLLNVSAATLSSVPAVGEKFKLYTVFNVREDAMELCGFATREEKRMYERLRTVGGVGSKLALQALSTLSVRDLSLALVTGDAGALCRVPGIGKKLAQRVLVPGIGKHRLDPEPKILVLHSGRPLEGLRRLLRQIGQRKFQPGTLLLILFHPREIHQVLSESREPLGLQLNVRQPFVFSRLQPQNLRVRVDDRNRGTKLMPRVGDETLLFLVTLHNRTNDASGKQKNQGGHRY